MASKDCAVDANRVTMLARARLVAEMCLLYVGGPVLLSVLVYRWHLPLLVILPIVFAVLFGVLLSQHDQSWRENLKRLPGIADLAAILATFVVLGGALTLLAYLRYPQSFLAFPTSLPRLWLWVMILYPLASVTAQELIFRLLFFHRFATAMSGRIGLAIVVNAALFAAMHAILFPAQRSPVHLEALALSFGGGLLFARRYVRTRSFLAVAIEHALYGDLIFTIGLGRFFFTGVSHF